MQRSLAFVSVLLAVAGLIATPAIADDLAVCHDRTIAADDAIAACDRVLGSSAARGGDLAGTFVGRANAWFAKRDYDRAMADYDQAIDRNARMVPAYAGRARTRYAKADFDGAIADYDQALRINPRAVVFYIDRGNVWRRKGDVDHAIADYAEAIRVDPTFAGAFISRGLALEGKGDREHARADYEAVLALPPKGDPGKRILDSARARLASLGSTERAVAVATRATTPPVNSTVTATAPAPPSAPPPATRVTSMVGPAVAAIAAANPGPAKPAPAAPRAQATQVAMAPVPAAATASPVIAPARIPADTGYRLALVIGNGAYVNATGLPNPPNDARAVARTLREMGFEVMDGTDLDRTAMERLIRDFLRKAPNARVTLLFYAGHGMQVDGKNYLVPVDAKLSAPSDLGFETIELDKILAGLDDEARANIVILDACRDNPLARSFASRTRSAAVPSGLAGYSTVGTGTLIAFATAPGQTALDGRDANSPFTTALIKHMRTPGMEVNQMLTRVRVEVASNTGNKQIPWANSSLLGDVYLGGGAKQ